MKKISFLFLMMIFISGCYILQAQSPGQTYHNYDRQYTFEIVSEPGGVKIEINNFMFQLTRGEKDATLS
ncbi:MAG TPA: hypothetical protein VJA84_01640 [Candidatus Omnitrophota bacterium]|nr:hypothetical protein [Candidatus Omnitrophota bacterium]